MPSFTYDPEIALTHLSTVDPLLARVIEQVGPFVLERRAIEDIFQPLLRSIVYQQLSGKAAATIHGRVQALAEGGLPLSPSQLLALPDEALRGAGLSRAKTAAARDLAEKTLNGMLPTLEEIHAMPDDEVVRRLTQVRGVGTWTAEMILIFYLGRPDILPVTDLGVRKGFMLMHGTETLPSPAELLAHGESWRPYRSVASWYLWRRVDTVLL